MTDNPDPQRQADISDAHHEGFGAGVAWADQTPDSGPIARRQIILNTVTDLVSDFLYYDRKEDEDLPRGAIDEAIAAGEITRFDIVAAFSAELNDGLGGIEAP